MSPFTRAVLQVAWLGLGGTLALRGEEAKITSKTPAAAQPGEVVVSIVGDHMGFAEGMKALIDAYHKFHPEIHVSVESKGLGYGVGYPTWLNTQLTSGDPRPDVVSGNYCPDYAHYVNLDYYGGQTNPYTGRPMNEGLDFDFFRSLNSRGERILLSTQMVKIMWFYNRDIFDRLHLSPPRTWDEFLEVCAKLKQAGILPLSLRFNYRFYQWLSEILFDQYTRPYIQIIRAQPGDWCYDPERDGDWKYDPANPLNDAKPTVNFARYLRAIQRHEIPYDDAAFIHMLESLKSLAPYVPSDFLVDTPSADSETYTLFLNGTAAIHLDMSSLLMQIDGDLASAANFRWATFDTPSQVNEYVKAPARSVESSAGEYIGVINKNQAQTDRVMDFVHFWLSAQGYQIYVDAKVAAGKYHPAGPVMVHGVKLPAEFEKRFGAIVRRGNAEILLNGLSTVLPDGSRLNNDLKQTLADMMQGKIEPREAARRIQAIMYAGVGETLARNRLDQSFLEHPERDPNG